MANFFIIVPTLNASEFIDRCLSSIILVQPGNFGLRVHVQDGGSADNTLELVNAWKQKGVTFSSENDTGIYDSINRAAKRADINDIMTWLGSDDILLPGTLATVASIFDNLKNIEWITGQNFVGNEDGEGYTPWRSGPYIREDIISGFYDGRMHGFIMQEGTFWRSSLWNKANGLDAKFKHAGDWDLWRRFAQYAPLYEITFPLARFTRRPGQKSQDKIAYYQEIDKSRGRSSVRDRTSHELRRYPWTPTWRIKKRTHLMTASDKAKWLWGRS